MISEAVKNATAHGGRHWGWRAAAASLLLTACSTPAATGSAAVPTGGSSPAPSPSRAPSSSASVSITGGPSASAAAFLASGGHECAAGQLRGVFRTGEEGAGNLITTVWVGNSGDVACLLPGPVTLVGLDRHGVPDTTPSECDGVDEDTGDPCVAPVVLPPDATFARLDQVDPETSQYAVIGVIGFYRDDPDSPDGLCTPAHTTTPYTLRFTFGTVVVDVRNWDPATTSIPAGIHAVFACHGAVHL